MSAFDHPTGMAYPAPGCRCVHCTAHHNNPTVERTNRVFEGLPPGGAGPYGLTAEFKFLVYTISGVYAFKSEEVAIAFASRLLSRGDELMVIVSEAKPIKKLSNRIDPNIDIEDFDSGRALTE